MITKNIAVSISFLSTDAEVSHAYTGMITRALIILSKKNKEVGDATMDKYDREVLAAINKSDHETLSRILDEILILYEKLKP